MSSKPRKSRKAFMQMPTHKRVKKIAGHASEKIKKEIGKRSLSLRKGDIVKVVRGMFKGKSGKIIHIDHAKLKIKIEGVKRKKSDGTELNMPIDPSNIIIEELDRSDAKRLGQKKGVIKK
jgi:large subunit ribosomal protein L24